jgi:aryl-alcohol dehydrogenase-like predicted oxidoreductase
METRKIGQLDVTVVGVGCNNFGMKLDADATADVVFAALDHGINFFDTADIYGRRGGSEEMLGRALSKRVRNEVVVATKFGMPMDDNDESMRGGSAPWVKRAIDDSLRRLDVEYIDLYQLHAPDEKTPIAETLDALNDLVRAGKVREIGCSNFSGAQIEEADAAAASGNIARFVSVQNQWNLLEREMEKNALPAAERHGVAVLPYFPLASGLLTGKYKKGEEPPKGTRLALFGERAKPMLADDNMERVRQLENFAISCGRTLLELAMSWLASHDSVASVIAGATSADQVVSNIAAASWRLSDDERAAVDEIIPPPNPEP